MANNKTDFLENALINHVLRNVPYVPPVTVFVALFTAAPGEAGGGTEVPTAGTAYARQAGVFAAAAGGATSNSADITYAAATLAWGTITHFAVFDAVAVGNMLYYGPLTVSKVVGVGDQAKFLAGTLQVAEL